MKLLALLSDITPPPHTLCSVTPEPSRAMDMWVQTCATMTGLCKLGLLTW